MVDGLFSFWHLRYPVYLFCGFWTAPKRWNYKPNGRVHLNILKWERFASLLYTTLGSESLLTHLWKYFDGPSVLYSLKETFHFIRQLEACQMGCKLGSWNLGKDRRISWHLDISEQRAILQHNNLIQESILHETKLTATQVVHNSGYKNQEYPSNHTKTERKTLWEALSCSWKTGTWGPVFLCNIHPLVSSISQKMVARMCVRCPTCYTNYS